ncbi:hypothetical protein AHA02nite_25730 [Alkalibacillus haloalkaliphilus]|uniref:Uncharacterized protein n=1 Tax=Alkalibacillus haloalkaliphilus TaxID=94136 RepID=A0A511W714_9BACI|nr:hypothetical protein AHA02nite_25730 [Alkalibacillus haloalkaliphilus]
MMMLMYVKRSTPTSLECFFPIAVNNNVLLIVISADSSVVADSVVDSVVVFAVETVGFDALLLED